MPKVAKRKAKAVATRPKPRPKRKRRKTPMTDNKDKAPERYVEKSSTAPAPKVETTSVPPADLRTEQEKDTASGVPGVGPASASEPTSGPAETIEALGIGPREPYPTTEPVAATATKKGPSK